MTTSAELAVCSQKPLRVANVVLLRQNYLFYGRCDIAEFASGKRFQLCKIPLVAEGQDRGPFLDSEKLRVDQIPGVK